MAFEPHGLNNTVTDVMWKKSKRSYIAKTFHLCSTPIYFYRPHYSQAGHFPISTAAHFTSSSSLSSYFVFFLSSYFHFLLLQCLAVEHPGRRRWCAFCAALNPLQLGSTLRLLNHLGEKPENVSASEHVWCLPAFLAGVQLATGTYRRTVTLVMAFGTKSGKKAIQAAFLWDQDQYDNLGICTVSPCFAGSSLILAAGTRRQSLQSRPWPGTRALENMKWISNWLDNVELSSPHFKTLISCTLLTIS